MVSAPAGHFELCRVAYTSNSGSAVIRFTALEAMLHPKWNPHFGVILTDADGNTVYKVAVLATPAPLRLREAQQMFVVSDGGKEMGNVLSEVPDFEEPVDSSVEMALEWKESGFVRVKLNGRSLGFVKPSKPHQQWNLFVSGMTLGYELSGAVLGECKI